MKRRDLIAVIEAMHTAAQAVIGSWEHGDLAAAVRALVDADTELALPALEWWEKE